MKEYRNVVLVMFVFIWELIKFIGNRQIWPGVRAVGSIVMIILVTWGLIGLSIWQGNTFFNGWLAIELRTGIWFIIDYIILGGLVFGGYMIYVYWNEIKEFMSDTWEKANIIVNENEDKE